MSQMFQNAKTALLVAAIGVAAILTTGKAEARDMQTITVAGGCFWCVEADFEKVQGVTEVTSGYTGGATIDPTYGDVTGGGTGHYEAVEIRFDRDQIGERQIYDLFFRSIDPLDAGGQFCDRGDSYRTAIFVSTQAQLEAARAAKAAAESELGQAVVTPILQAAPFYEAENYHQDYYKGSRLLLTRAGPKTQREAYSFYREACGRDDRVEAIWGPDAPFLKP